MNVPRRMEIGAGMIGPCDANPPSEEAKAIVEDTEAKARAMADVDAGILERLAREKIRNLYRRSVYRCRARALGGVSSAARSMALVDWKLTCVVLPSTKLRRVWQVESDTAFHCQ